MGALKFSDSGENVDATCLTQANHITDEQAVAKSKYLYNVSFDNWSLLTQTNLQSCLQCIIKGFGCTKVFSSQCHSSVLDSSNKYTEGQFVKTCSLCELLCPAVLRHCMVQSKEIIW